MNKYEKIRNIIKDLQNDGVVISDLKIIYEIDCQLENEIDDETYDNLFCNIENVYFSTDSIPISTITNCAIKNIDKLNDENFDLLEESCYWGC